MITGFTPRLTPMGSVPLVLMYHSVTPYTEDPYLITVRPGRFREQMDWLDRLGLRGVSARELMAARARGGGQGLVGLTFDDGYRDFVECAMPVLRSHGFTATVFVVAGRMGEQNEWDREGPRKQLMTADEVGEVAASGMEIGSHGLLHVSLPEATDTVLRNEVSKSRALLEEVSGSAVTGFCYPYGHADRRAVDAVRANGYDYGIAIWSGPLTGRFALPRTYIGDRDGSLRLLAKYGRHHTVTARRR
jgi:peptidoglycan/xylan/chitin deacetylase (PgdA/CDA1 family)